MSEDYIYWDPHEDCLSKDKVKEAIKKLPWEALASGAHININDLIEELGL